MNTHSEVLAKFATGYPGLALSESNVLAYLEEFSHLSLDRFERALKEAAKANPAFFPTVPQVQKALDTGLESQALNAHQSFLPAPTPPAITSSEEPKREPGWLYRMFLDKRNELRARKLCGFK